LAGLSRIHLGVGPRAEDRFGGSYACDSLIGGTGG
jgi:hypothetical protein